MISSTSGDVVAINVNNAEADVLTRKFAQLEGVGITDAIVIAMKEAIARRRQAETPLETAARLRAQHGIDLTPAARKALAAVPRTGLTCWPPEQPAPPAGCMNKRKQGHDSVRFKDRCPAFGSGP